MLYSMKILMGFFEEYQMTICIKWPCMKLISYFKLRYSALTRATLKSKLLTFNPNFLKPRPNYVNSRNLCELPDRCWRKRSSSSRSHTLKIIQWVSTRQPHPVSTTILRLLSNASTTHQIKCQHTTVATLFIVALNATLKQKNINSKYQKYDCA